MRAERVPGLRRLPPLLGRVRPRLVLYNAWWGKFADSPKAIFEELRRRDAPFEHVWLLDDPGRAPEGARAVRPGSADWLRESGRAGYVVSNNTLPGYFHKKRGQTYLQTWHGAALKRIALDIERPSFSGSERYLRNLRHEVEGWDYLIAPNRFSGEVMRGAFGYGGEVLETGYPRNDVLLAPGREAAREQARAALGIPAGARAVLYAPTWRDDGAFSTELDLDALAGALGDNFVVLVRAHNAVASTVALPESSRLRDVSGRDDAGELLLAADVLVTDYSSVMFDFACTGRPIVLFTYDLERYRDELRGFYFDLASEAPGPLVASTAELADVLRDIDAVRDRLAPAYSRFRERFCDLDDGNAAARVVDAVFSV